MQVDQREKYQQMRTLLNEKQWRQYLALEAKERGSISVVVQEAGASPNTIRRGMREVEAAESYRPGERQRKAGGGRKKLTEKDTTLQADLEGLLDPKGDPMSLLKWTSKSVAHLKNSLQAMGHTIADTALRDLLRALGYRLAANKKNLEGHAHEDRDAQFAQIKEQCEQFEQRGEPIMRGGLQEERADWEFQEQRSGVASPRKLNRGKRV